MRVNPDQGPGFREGETLWANHSPTQRIIRIGPRKPVKYNTAVADPK